MTSATTETFWHKLEKEMKETTQDYYFQFHLESDNKRSNKFKVIIKKIFDIFFDDIKGEKQNQDLLQNCWEQTVNHFIHLPEIRYVQKLMEKILFKYYILFGILLSEKTLFSTLKDVASKLSFLYNHPESKLNNLESDFKKISFLEKCSYRVLGQQIDSYSKFLEKQREQQTILKLEKQKMKRKQEQRIKQQEQRQKLQKINAEKQAEIKQKKMKDLRTANQQQNAITLRDKAIQSSMFPSQYKPVHGFKQPIRTPQQTQYLKEQKKFYKKRSQQLYETKFRTMFESFSFRLKPQQGENKSQCFQCKKPLITGFLSIGGNTNYCNYTGEWFCNEHMSLKRYPIPWRALEHFDLRGYAVSKYGEDEISAHYNSTVLQLQLNNPIIDAKKLLYEFLVVKREIHLIYDSICNGQLVFSLLENKMNYCLQRNIFSLKNLYDVYNGQEVHGLNNYAGILGNHFIKCQICQKRRGHLCGKCKKPPKIFPFELKDNYCCRKCRKIYHRTCLINNKCECDLS